MRGAVLVAVAVILLASAAANAVSAQAACVEVVRWRDQTYLGVGPSKRVLAIGAMLSGGVVPGCRDQIPGPREPDVPVRLRAIAGVPVKAALVRADRPNRIFLAPGFFPQLPDFPLHDAILGMWIRARITECRRGTHFRYAVADRIDVLG